MDGRGRHVASGSSAFVRDLVVMAVGIVIVGVLLYGGLSLIAGLGGDDDPEAADTTTTTEVTTTGQSGTQTTTTTAPTTTTTEPTTTTTTLPLARPPAEVTVLVLNSTGRSGIAGALATRLGEAGFQTLPADNYAPQLDQSRVWYLGDFAPEAVDVQAEFVPDALVEAYEGPDIGADIVIVLGAGYEG
ncbi:MAG TPA: LytR C-terminal domain-containing protein [Acidimicrobiia bacterium]|nr:LytR C-terminal domain-containing protein [Acidimicrobiia bacterium]